MEGINKISVERLRNLHGFANVDGFFNLSFWPKAAKRYLCSLSWNMEMHLLDFHTTLRVPYLSIFRKMRSKALDVAVVQTPEGKLDFAFLVIGERWYALRNKTEDASTWMLEGYWRESLTTNVPVHLSGEFHDLWLQHLAAKWGFSSIDNNLHLEVECDIAMRCGCFNNLMDKRDELIRTVHLKAGGGLVIAFAIVNDQCYPLTKVEKNEAEIKNPAKAG